ncbi:MAG: hypothetical protein GC201_15035 [Alphaproteobacteria bacterium]|nr:hypothetical protein [Alphaproteobacteria bacterium]
MRTGLLAAALALAASAAWAGSLEPLQDYVDSRGHGEMDHSYPLVRCGALYMTSLKAAGTDLTPEKAEQVQATAMKMAAIAAKFRMQPGDDPTAVANGVMDDLEGLMAQYAERGGGQGFGGDSLVKKDFKYCRTVTEPFVQAYDMNPPPAAQ